MKLFFMPEIAALISIVAVGFNSSGSFQNSPSIQTSLTGAWNAKNGEIDNTLVFQDGYFSYSIYDKANKKFIRTWGGTFSEAGGQVHANIEFDTESKDNIGGHKHFAATISGNTLNFDAGTGVNSWTKVDDGNTNLAGNWRITGRMRDGSIQTIERSARKTV